MRVSARAILISFLVIAAPLSAQQPTAPAAPDPIGEQFFAPELVMQHQGEIALTDEQRRDIMSEIQQAQRRATEGSWQLQREVESITQLLRHDPIDEEKMLAQLDRLLAGEREIKRIQLTLLARIRNRLTPDQRTRLQAIRCRGSD
jgi:Spy/CpxP family protein refolding chaperone